MLNPLLLGLVSSATAALTGSALDSSSAALTSLDNIGSLVEIGASGGTSHGHGHSHGGGSGHDDVHEYWSAMPSSPSTYEVVIGDKLSFKYTEYHNVYLMPSQEAYASCDFSAATELANATYGGGEGSIPNNYEAVTTATGTLYFACQISGHCAAGQKIAVTVAGQKIAVTVTEAPAPPPPADSPAPHLAPGRLGVLLLVAAASLLSISL